LVILTLAYVRLAALGWLLLTGYGPAPAIDPEAAAAPAPPEEDITWLMSAPWGKAAIILVAAMAVLFLGNTLMMRKKKAGGGRMSRLDFDVSVARLEDTPRVAIADAKTGPVHLTGRVLSATGTLGSRDGHARVWNNRAGAGRRTAVGAELAVVGDETGQIGIEGLEGARVIAPREAGKLHDTVSLYVGDLVQVLGHFVAEHHGDDAESKNNIYGMMGADRQVQLRVLERYDGAAGARVDPAEATEEAPTS
jgi:hypothetical protein